MRIGFKICFHERHVIGTVRFTELNSWDGIKDSLAKGSLNAL